MTTKRLFSTLALIFFFILNANAQNVLKVQFIKGDFEDIKNMVTGEGKILLIEFSEKPNEEYNYLKNNVFNDEKIALLLNDKFVLYHYNRDFDKRKKLMKKFNVKYNPTYVFADAELNELYKLAGSFSKEDLINACNFALSPDNNLMSWKMAIEEKTASSSVYFNYAKALYLAKEDYVNAASDYFKHSDTDFNKDPNGVEAVLLFTEDMYEPRFVILMEHHNEINPEFYDYRNFKLRTNEIISNSLVQTLAADTNISLEDTVNSTAEQFNLDDPMRLMSLVKMKYYKTVKDNPDERYKAMTDYLASSSDILGPDKTFEYLDEIIKNSNNNEVLTMANTTLFDLIAQYNKPEYQVALIDLSLKLKNFDEARHAFEVLQHFNMESHNLSRQEMDKLKNKIDNAQLVEKGLAPKEKTKKKKGKKKKRK